MIPLIQKTRLRTSQASQGGILEFPGGGYQIPAIAPATEVARESELQRFTEPHLAVQSVSRSGERRAAWASVEKRL